MSPSLSERQPWSGPWAPLRLGAAAPSEASGGIVLAPAVSADAAAIAALLRGGAPDTIPVPDSEIRRRIHEYEVLRHPRWGLVGAVAIRRFAERRWELRSLVVASGWSGRGLGERLVRRVFARTRAAGCALVCVTLRPGFFTRLGFVPVPLDSLPEKPDRPERVGGRRRVAMVWSGLAREAA